MKVAFVFSGMIRDLERTTEAYQNKIAELGADVFASFWDVENPEKGDTVANFVKAFKPKRIEIENNDAWRKTTWEIIQSEFKPQESLFWEGKQSILNGNSVSMWYKIWRANMLTKIPGENYDIVIRTRTDNVLSKEFTPVLNSFLNIIKGDVSIPGFQNCLGPHDFFAYGAPEIMDYYSSAFLYLSRYLKDGHYIYPAENILRVHLAQRDIMIRRYYDSILLKHDGNVGRDEVTPDHIYSSTIYRGLDPDPDLSCFNPPY
jgi:hypothetical protein